MRGSLCPQLHKKAGELPSLSLGATTKRGSPFHQLQEPQRSVGVGIPNGTGHRKEWQTVSPTLRRYLITVAGIPVLRGHTKEWETIFPTPRPHQSMGRGISNSKGPIEA